MFTLWIGDPDEEDVEKLDDVTLGGEPEVFRAFKTITDMFAQEGRLTESPAQCHQGPMGPESGLRS